MGENGYGVVGRLQGDNQVVRSLRRARTAFRLVALGLIVAAVSQELSRPKHERHWHGQVLGLVPYDFRMPTLGRIRAAYWNPDSTRVFSDKVLGVGWAVNFYRLREIATQAAAWLSAQEETAAPRARRRRPRNRHGDGARKLTEEPATARSGT